MFRKAICGLVTAACLTATPALAMPEGELSVPVTEFTLPNGLHVILHEDHTVPIVATNIWYWVGSANEQVGRTGFAHLFEHLMFCGSGHVAKGDFDNFLEKVGGNNNASTNEDRTNYYISLPSNAVDLALFLESDRMGYLTDSMSRNIVDEQRDVVKNEMRQRYLNTPYGKVYLEIPRLMYPEGHPYSWPVIGSMDDLTAAGYDDVVAFFKKNYNPNNASLAIAGDFDTAEMKAKVEHWFSDVPRGAASEEITAAPVQLKGVIKKTLTDNVSLPYRMFVWHTPAEFTPDDASLDVLALVLANGKNSRLYKRLVYEMQIAQAVDASQMSQRLGSLFSIDFLPKPGHTLEEIQTVVEEEIARISKEAPTQEEINLAVNGLEAGFYRAIEKSSNKANYLNRYYRTVGKCDYFAEDLARYTAVTPEMVRAVAAKYLLPDKRLELTVIPEPKEEAAEPAPAAKQADKDSSADAAATAKEAK